MDYAAARDNMVESQLRTNRVSDPAVLEAFSAIPRERFVPGRQRGIAYIDEDLLLEDGRYLLEPMVLARMLQAAEIGPEDVALEVGCGTGYGAAILNRLAGTVIALEEQPKLRDWASAVCADLGLDSVLVVCGSLVEGYEKQAPYDVILLSGAVTDVPSSIVKQLADGGRLVAVIRPQDGIGAATLVQRSGNSVSRRALFDAACPYLPGFKKETGFVFRGGVRQAGVAGNPGGPATGVAGDRCAAEGADR